MALANDKTLLESKFGGFKGQWCPFWAARSYEDIQTFGRGLYQREGYQPWRGQLVSGSFRQLEEG